VQDADPAALAYGDPAQGEPDRPRSARRARPPRRHLSFTTIYTVSVVTIIAIVAAVYLTRPRDTSGPASAADVAFVTRSAQHTLAQQTAQMSMAGTIKAEGQTVSLSGTGEFNFRTHSAELAEIIAADGHGVNMTFIETGGNAYFKMSVDGKTITDQTGREWAQVPVKSSSQASVTGGNAQSALLLLEQQGATVRTLGKKSIGGVTCTGYSVRPSRQAMAAAAQKQVADLKLPASAADAASSVERPTITVWLDAHGLLRQMTANMQIGGLPGSNAAASAGLTMNFSDYGAPVRVSAPPPADVTSLPSLVQGVGHSSL
jgi:hypothetical protein